MILLHFLTKKIKIYINNLNDFIKNFIKLFVK